jgi:hypothetical protein
MAKRLDIKLSAVELRVLSAIVAARVVGLSDEDILREADQSNLAMTAEELREAKGALFQYGLIERNVERLCSTPQGRKLIRGTV